MIGMTQRKRIKDKKPTIRSRYPRSPAKLVKFHVGKNKNHSHHYFWHLCFDVVVKLVPLCLDLCTNWLIIKCTPNINLFYIIVLIQRLFIYKFQFQVLFPSLLVKGLKKVSDAKKIEPLTFLISWLMISFLEKATRPEVRGQFRVSGSLKP